MIRRPYISSDTASTEGFLLIRSSTVRCSIPGSACPLNFRLSFGADWITPSGEASDARMSATQ